MSTHSCRVQFLDDTDPFSSTSFPEPSRPPLFAFSEDLPLIEQVASVHRFLRAPHKLDDCTLQLSHTGTYLDLESSLAEQRDELDGFFDEPGRSKKHTIILRTQLSVRVNACIEKLYNSSGRELRRALFSLKQIFQDDKDLVHEFVNSEGLTCLVRVGEAADQNYQNYILRALGQIMLYVDGMNGVIAHNETIQWLYSLIASKFRLVARTALKLLLVFVEYTETNAPLLIHAAACADQKAGKKSWSTLISVLGEMDGMDTELLVFTLTLLNKTLAALPDQDSFYDVTDRLEELGMEAVARSHLAMRGVDQDLAEQFAIYEASMRHEDGEEDVTAPSSCRRDRRRSSTGGADTNGTERRRSRRHGSFVSRGRKPLSSQSTSPRVEMLSDSELTSPVENDPALSPESVNSATSPFSPTTCSDHLPYVPYTTFHLCSYEPAGTSTPCTTPAPTEEQSGTTYPSNGACSPCSPTPANNYPSNAACSPCSPTPANYPSNGACSPCIPPTANKTCSRVGPGVTGSVGQGVTGCAGPGVVGSPGNAGLLSSSYKQHQESLAAERERRRQQREERLQRIEREERNKYKSRYLERMAAEEREKELKPCTRSRLNLQPLVESLSPSTFSQVTSPTILSPSPSPTSRSPSPIPLYSPRTPTDSPPQNSFALKTDSTSAMVTPLSPSEVRVPACTHSTPPLVTSSTVTISHSESPPETMASTATTTTSQVSSMMMRKQDSGCREAEPLVLSEKERASVAVNEKEVCSASGSSSASSTLERDKAPSETAGGGSQVSDSMNGGRSVSNTSEQCDSSALSTPTDPVSVDINTEGVKSKPEIDSEPTSSIEGLAQRLNIVPGKPTTRENEGETDTLHKTAEVDAVPRKESDQLWDQLLTEPRELRIKDMDFTDLTDEDDIDFLQLNLTTTADMTVPPPLPASFLLPPPPPGCPPPPPFPGKVFPSSVTPFTSSNASGVPTLPCKKKTVRLFWNEVRQTEWKHRNHRYGTRSIWALLELVTVDTNKLELLFETKSKELPANKRTSTEGKKNEVTVLDSKRSNAINIGLTVLPPPRTIKTAILNFDEYALNKEGIEKLLAMIPTEEEKQRIQEAQLAQPNIPLGPAEQFLLTMASISELGARLQLWAFKMDYESMEKEIVEPLADLKQGMEQLEENKTLRCILATLLAIGNFLNTSNAKGFELTYLEKVSEVKDTARKQSLLHHLCTIVLEKFPNSSDLYSEIGAVTRSAKVDFEQLHDNLGQLERRCRSSWDHLKVISRHESRAVLRQRVAVFLRDCAARIIVLQTVHRRLLNRFHAFLLYAGHSPASAREFSVTRLCRVVSEFALEYRTTRERILQQQQKRASHRERNKTRGKMITDSGRFSSESTAGSSAPLLPIAGLRRLPTSEQNQEHESMTAVLQASLGRGTTLGAVTSSPILGGSRGRSRRGRVATVTATDDSPIAADDATDEIMDRIVRSATQAPCARAATRERRRSRANRKSLRRTLKSGLTPEEAKALGLMNTPEVQV
uniref:FH1/FH2 domain-containing protein 3-like isoform X2 n=1 Tax=Myxine glutinosa TaxID=7769 RepID=UPI00358F38DF